MALATLYVTAQGVEVVATGKRRWVDTHWFRGNSYFRIGWEWVKTALDSGWQLIHQVRFVGNSQQWLLANNTTNDAIAWNSQYKPTTAPLISFVSQPGSEQLK